MKTELLKENLLYVDDLEIAERFYTNIIGLMVTHRIKDQYSLFNFDDNNLILFQTPVMAEGTTAESSQPGHFSFGISPPDISSWREHLKKHDVPIEKEITWPNGAKSIYFRDPAGNGIKLTTQTHGIKDRANEENVQQISSGGLNAKWKIFHAANIGGQSGSNLSD